MSVALTRWQAGIESTRFTAVGADRPIYKKAPIPDPARGREHIGQSRGNFVATFDTEETHEGPVKWTHEGPANFETLAWWFLLALRGGVSPSGAGPYTMTYASAETSDDLDSASFEVTDGVGVFKLPGAMVRSWELSGKGGRGPTLVTAKFDLLAPQMESGITMTGDISDLDITGSYMLFKNTELYIDDAAGSIGTAAVGTLTEFSLKMDNALEPDFVGNNSGRYNAIDRGERYLEFMATLRFDSTAYDELQNHWESNDVRFLQLKNTGASNDLLTVNLATKLESFTFGEDGPTRRVALMGRSKYDPTLGYDWQVEIQNDVASY